MSSIGYAQVEYVKVCSLYGAGFHYIPGTDICKDDYIGDSRQQTENGTWRTLLPYPEGEWVQNPEQECTGQLMPVGNFKSTDFVVNLYQKKQTAPIRFPLKPNQFISKVLMSGGFSDPRLPTRHGTNANDGLCVRSIDPNIMEGPNMLNPPFGNGGLPIGCIANSRLLNMPSTYAISATSTYPDVDAFFSDANQTVAGPYTYGTSLVITTDITSNAMSLTYYDASTQTTKPMAGTLSVSVCVGNNGPGR
jgi:hypothetical protein